jgi:CPA1 family monovalent cation:H+ antiporter
VLAFLLMGLQAREIVGGMSPGHLRAAAVFAAIVIATLVLVRIAWVILYGVATRRRPALAGTGGVPTARQSVLIGWCGMRGLLTLATAFALPAGFPQRDLIVLTAFAVVLATLVLQGLTLAPLVRLLGLSDEATEAGELGAARVALAEAGLVALAGRSGTAAEHWRYALDAARDAWEPGGDGVAQRQKREVGLAALRRQRERLEELRAERRIGPEAFLELQEELDFLEVTLSDENSRRIEPS